MSLALSENVSIYCIIVLGLASVVLPRLVSAGVVLARCLSYLLAAASRSVVLSPTSVVALLAERTILCPVHWSLRHGASLVQPGMTNACNSVVAGMKASQHHATSSLLHPDYYNALYTHKLSHGFSIFSSARLLNLMLCLVLVQVRSSDCTV